MMTIFGWLKRRTPQPGPYEFALAPHPTLGAMGESFQPSAHWPRIHWYNTATPVAKPIYSRIFQPLAWSQPGQVLGGIQGVQVLQPFAGSLPLVNETFEQVAPPTGVTYGQL